jgi:hypothetical protein
MNVPSANGGPSVAAARRNTPAIALSEDGLHCVRSGRGGRADVQISRFRFFMGEPRSQWCNDGQFGARLVTAHEQAAIVKRPRCPLRRANGRADILLAEPGCLALQVEEPA